MVREFNGQAGQDYFVLKCLKNKTNGTFLEIGSNDPVHINNSYILETKYNWKGIMVEYDSKYLESYRKLRNNSLPIIQDATTINFPQYFEALDLPRNVDYLQIDLEVHNESTLKTLENLNKQIMDTYKFAVVTFEHDIYRGDHYNTRARSREIFESRGYVRVFSDVDNWVPEEPNTPYPFEDWYVHPDLVDMDYIRKVMAPEKSMRWREILDRLDSV